MNHIDQPETRPLKRPPSVGLASLTLMLQCQELHERLAELETRRARALARAEELREMAREHDVIARNATERALYIRTHHLADLQATLSDWSAEGPKPTSHARHAALINVKDHAE